MRTALLALGLLGLVYAASRRAGSGDPALSPGEVRETVDDAAPCAESEPAIEEIVDEEAEEAPADEAESGQEDEAETDAVEGRT